MSDTAIEITDLSKTYRSGWFGRGSIAALQGVNLHVPQGQIFGLLGPNGAGKTTLVKILLGILSPNAGRVSVLDRSQRNMAVRQRIGYLPENLQIPRHHTATSAMYFFGRLSRLSDSTIGQRLPELMQLVGLKGRENEYVRTYSKGMKQRLGLAQSLLHEPDLLFMDEPTDGLDPVGRHHIRQCIEGLRDRGKTVFLNSHILQEVELVCDQVAIMARGKVLAIGRVDQLLDQLDSDATRSIRVEAIGSLHHANNVATQFAAEQLSIQTEVVGLVASSTTQSDPKATQTISFVLHSLQQPLLDKLIDLLRRNDFAIREIQRGSATLEQLFMQLVSASENATPSAL